MSNLADSTVPSWEQLLSLKKGVTLVDITNAPNTSDKQNKMYTDTGETDKGTIVQKGKDFFFQYMDGKLLNLKNYFAEVERSFSEYIVTLTGVKSN